MLKNTCKICGWEIPKEDREPEEYRLTILFGQILDAHGAEMPETERKMINKQMESLGMDMEGFRDYMTNLKKNEVKS